MAKFFRGGKLLVAFFALFIIVWLILKMVSNERLQAESQLLAEDVFTWIWPDRGFRSSAKFWSAEILSRGEHEAVVKVKGKQTLTRLKALLAAPEGSVDKESGQSETVDCAARLHLYLSNKKWVLGSVEILED